MIPHIIHQTWKTTDLPDQLRENRETWQRHHPDWTYMFWTDADIEAFVPANFPRMVELFNRYPDKIQRIDAVRYMILYSYGGVYADLDVVCRRPFDDLCGHDVFLPQTAPIGVSNDLIGASQGSPFFAYLLDQLEPAYRRWPRHVVPRHFRVLLTTGSLFVTNALRRWPGRAAVHIMPPHLYGDGRDPHPYVTHTPGGTWQNWDSTLILFAFRHIRAIGIAALVLIVAIILLTVRH